MSAAAQSPGGNSEPFLSVAYHENEFKPIEEANISIATHGFQYGIGCFGGVRGYYNEEQDQCYLFRLEDHVKRLVRSGNILDFQTKKTEDEIGGIIRELGTRNDYRGNTYFRPFFYSSEHRLSPRTHDVNIEFALYSMPLTDYIDTSRGLKVQVSSWNRIEDNIIPSRAKASGGYLNSALAKSEALRNGCDEAIFLNRDGGVSEGTTENLFLVRDGVLVTPTCSDNILEGITRKTLITLAEEELGLTVQRRSIGRTELYISEEVFFTGTGAQVAWITEIDGRTISKDIGPVTAQLKSMFLDVVVGKNEKYKNWLTPLFERKN